MLQRLAKKLVTELEEVNNTLFKALQLNIRAREYAKKGFKNLINAYVDLTQEDGEHGEEPGYDDLDILINGLFPSPALPNDIQTLEPEMVFYQKTPARIVFELVEKIHFDKEDVFFDLGSGLGQVAIMVNLLTGIPVKGIEFEPAFCAFARDCAESLGLSGISFVNSDARKADYSEGTIFFMYTPFKGQMLQDVLNLLRQQSLLRKITLITYGPCTSEVALQNWLRFEAAGDPHVYKPAVFTSL